MCVNTTSVIWKDVIVILKIGMYTKYHQLNNIHTTAYSLTSHVDTSVQNFYAKKISKKSVKNQKIILSLQSTSEFFKISRSRLGSACPWFTLSQSYSHWSFQCGCLVIQTIGITINLSCRCSFSVQFYDMWNYFATSQSECLCICSLLSIYGWETQVHNSVSNKSIIWI